MKSCAVHKANDGLSNVFPVLSPVLVSTILYKYKNVEWWMILNEDLLKTDANMGFSHFIVIYGCNNLRYSLILCAMTLFKNFNINAKYNHKK